MKRFTQLQSLPQVGLKSVLKTLSHNCLSAFGKPIVHMLLNEKTRRKDKDWFSKRAFWIYVMACAYFSVAVLKEMHNSSCGNQFLQHSNKIH